MATLMEKNITRTHKITLWFLVGLLSMFFMLSNTMVVHAVDDILETETQKIEECNITVVEGAVNQKTSVNPEYVWTAISPDVGHHFKFEISVPLSGTGTLNANQIHITIPKHILKNRNNQYADTYQLNIPSKDNVNNESFVYQEQTNDILIYNVKAVAATSTVTFQVDYITSETTFQYTDMNASDRLVVNVDINKNAEILHATINGPSVYIDTNAIFQKSQKNSYGFFKTWQNSWGTAATFGIENPEQYYYTIWEVKTDVTATGPYTLSFLDTIGTKYGNNEIIGYTPSLNNEFSITPTTGLITSTGTQYAYFLTKCPQNTYVHDMHYNINNESPAMSLTKVDAENSGTTATSVFVNKIKTCDITVTNKIDMSQGDLEESQYDMIPFSFTIELEGLEAAQLSPQDIQCETFVKNAAQPSKQTLATILKLNENAASTINDKINVEFVLRDGESFRICELPSTVKYKVTEGAKNHYIASYDSYVNNNGTLQNGHAANDEENQSLALQAKEQIDEKDTNIEFVFQNTYIFEPYILPMSGMENQTWIIVLTLSGMFICGMLYWVVNRKYN